MKYARFRTSSSLFVLMLALLLAGAAFSARGATCDPWVAEASDCERPALESMADPGSSPLVFVSLTDPESEAVLLQSIDLFIEPNPNSGKFRLEIAGEVPEGAELRIINVEGEKVYSRRIDKAGYLYLNLQPLRKGIYFAQLRVGEKMISHPILYSYDEAEPRTAMPAR